MTRSKEGETTPSQPSSECCMCGDYGLSYELFRCKLCQFRSQHRYCSNQYPKAESYRVCNWCLSQKDDSVEKSSNSSSSGKNNSDQDDTKKKKKNINHGNLKVKRGTLQLQLNCPIKKQRSPEQSPSPASRKRIIASGGIEERLRSKSEEMSNSSNGIITKQVFRNKVRRYKLLDEVSSQ